jgi:hypothetical protein
LAWVLLVSLLPFLLPLSSLLFDEQLNKLSLVSFWWKE